MPVGTLPKSQQENQIPQRNHRDKPSLALSANSSIGRNKRFWVKDLSPQYRKELATVVPLYVFVAESPHVSEVEPEKENDRRPLCGVAGRQWWNLLSLLLKGSSDTNVSLEHLIAFCKKHRIAVLNSVQYPLDPKIAKNYPEAEPIRNLGFCKEAGPYSYKKLKSTQPVQVALKNLAGRLSHPSLAKASIHCLGNDAEWFVTQAVSQLSSSQPIGSKIPHPSAWWRRQGLYGRLAQERLSHLFGRTH